MGVAPWVSASCREASSPSELKRMRTMGLAPAPEVVPEDPELLRGVAGLVGEEVLPEAEGLVVPEPELEEADGDELDGAGLGADAGAGLEPVVDEEGAGPVDELELPDVVGEEEVPELAAELDEEAGGGAVAPEGAGASTVKV